MPKNERGNVEAPPFATALPGGTTHVDVPRVFAACRRLGVDFAPALVGFEASRGGMLPKIAGVVVCSEHAAAVRASALEDDAARQAKAREKRCGSPNCAFRMPLMRPSGAAQNQRDPPVRKPLCTVQQLMAARACREQVAVEAWRQVVHAGHQRLRLQASVDEEARLNSVTADARRKQARSREEQAAAAPQGAPARKRAAKGAAGENARGKAGKAAAAGARGRGVAAGKRGAKQPRKCGVVCDTGGDDATIGATLRRLVAAQADPQDVEML